MDKLASDQRSALMRKVRHKDTKTELAFVHSSIGSDIASGCIAATCQESLTWSFQAARKPSSFTAASGTAITAGREGIVLPQIRRIGTQSYRGMLPETKAI
jgi:hypothetical protein